MIWKELPQIDLDSELRHNGVVGYDHPYRERRQKFISTGLFDQHFDIGVGGFCAIFSQRCFRFVEVMDHDNDEAQSILGSIVLFFALNDTEFRANNVDISFFMTCFENSKFFEAIFKVLSGANDGLIRATYQCVAWMSYISSHFGHELQKRGLVPMMCQSLISRSPDIEAGKSGLMALSNLLLCCQDPADFEYMCSMLGVILEFAAFNGLFEEAVRLCFVLAAHSNMEFDETIIDFCEKNISRIPADYTIATLLTVVSKCRELFCPLSSSDLFLNFWSHQDPDVAPYVSDVDFSRLLKIVALGYSSLDSMVLQDKLLSLVNIPRVLDLLHSNTTECVLNTLEFFLETVKDIMQHITSNCRLTHDRFCEKHLLPIINRGSVPAKLLTARCLQALVTFSKPVRAWMHNCSSLGNVCLDALDSDNPSIQITFLELLWQYLDATYNHGESCTSSFFERAGIISLVESLSHSDSPEIAHLSKQITELHEMHFACELPSKAPVSS